MKIPPMPPAFLAFPLALFLFVSTLSAVQASQSGTSPCFQAAVAWIEALPQAPAPRSEEVLLSHSRSSCRFADYWLKDLANTKPSERRRTCKDLVLIWTHKECIYFRDTIFAPAYEPCKAWSRLMYERCMAGEILWFRENSESDAAGDGNATESPF